MADECERISTAWYEEGSIRLLGLLPAPSREIQQALIPPGGDWQCTAQPGAVTRSIFWHGAEVALINPRGQLSDIVESDVAMGICATPIMDKALRAIFVLADDPANLALIAKIARAAIACVERPAPPIPEPEA